MEISFEKIKAVNPTFAFRDVKQGGIFIAPTTIDHATPDFWLKFSISDAICLNNGTKGTWNDFDDVIPVKSAILKYVL